MTEHFIASSVLILVVLVLRHFLKGKISLRLQYALWALVLLRLMIPVSLFESPLSVMNAVERSAAYKTAGETLSDIRMISDVIRDSEMTTQEAREAGNGQLHEIQGYPSQSAYANLRTFVYTDALGVILARILKFVWLAGIAVVGMTLLISNLSFHRKLRKTRKVYPAEGCKLPVYVLDSLTSPCLFGLLRPSIYITPEVAGDETKLRHVLAHELTHYCHGDPIWAGLRGLCLAVYWVHPLVWLAAALSRRDAELACDEGTIKRIGEEERLEYGRTLIGLTCEKRKAMDLLCCATTMTDGKKGIKERIMLIAKKPKLLIPAVIAVVLVAAFAVSCTFTGAKHKAETDIVPLTAAEVEAYNKAFEPLLLDDAGNFRVNPLAHFFTSWYDRPEDLNLVEFLRYFPSEQVTDDAEFAALKDLENWPFGKDVTLDGMYVPIHRIPAAAVNEQLIKYMGITINELSGVGTEELLYLEEYDAFYNYTSDFAAGTFVCSSGERQGDMVRLFGNAVTLTLKYREDGFLIVSHQRSGDTGALSVTLEVEGNVPQAALDYAVDYVTMQVDHYNEAGRDLPEGMGTYAITQAKVTGLTQINTGTAGHTSGVNLYLLKYRLRPDHPENVVMAGGMQMEERDGEHFITEWGSTGQPFLLLAWEEGGTQTLWQRVCVTNTDSITQEYGTPELLERYGDAYTAAAMELYHRFLEDMETTAYTEALETAIIDFMDDGWWYTEDRKDSDFQAAAFKVLYKEETESSFRFYGISMYRCYGFSDGGFFVVEDFLEPCVITLDQETLFCTDFWVPGDGVNYEPDIYEKFPSDIAEEAALDAHQYDALLAESCDQKARVHGGIQLTGCLLTITSDGKTVAPYENPLWAQTYTENGWLYGDGRSVSETLQELSSSLPSVTLREDLELSFAEQVSRGGGLDVYNENYDRLYHNADLLFLTALPEGTYYVSILVTKQGDYIEAAGDYERFGYECVFLYIVDESSYDALLMSRPLNNRVSVMLRRTVDHGFPGYIVPDEQDAWISALESAVRSAKEGEGWLESETSLGLYVIWQEAYWQVADSGALIDAKSGRVEPEDAAELYALMKPIAEKYEIGGFNPDLVTFLRAATLDYGDTYTVTDPETLSKLRVMLSGAAEIRGGTGCPFDALLELELEDGTVLKLAMATDSCAVYMVNGVYFDYGDGDNTEFFSLFHIKP